MRWIIIAALVVFSALLVVADNDSSALCTDSDGGGERSADTALTVAGEVKYGITPMADTCITRENGISTGESAWLREYYCRDDQRESEEYDCVALGYDKCVDGACVGNTTQAQQQQQVQEEEHCGNKILEKDEGEECDPPGSICFGKTSAEYGQCNNNCQCEIAASAERAPDVCGDGVVDEGEQCEEDADCEENYVCSSCSCVKQLTEEEIEQMKGEAKEKEEAEDEGLKREIDEKYRDVEPPEVNVSAKNFSDDPGIKATSGIAKFFKKVFAWFAGLFV